MVDSEPNWLKVILIKNEEDNRIAEILSVEFEPGSKTGDNYASTIVRVIAKVVLNSGKVTTKRFIIKKALTDAPKEALNEMRGIFTLEGIVYQKFLETLNNLICEYNTPYSKFWPECVFASHDMIMFEDLRQIGFTLGKRQTGLDLDHAKLVNTNLARLHSLSMKAISEGTIFPKILPLFMLIDSSVAQSLFQTSLKALANVIRDDWGPEWSRVEKKVRSMINNIIPEMKKIYQESNKFLVMNHGDCWVNNMMFKYDPTGRPIDHKFLDFQICHYNSFAWDLTYFMHSSINPRNVEAFQETLIEVYCNELCENLKRLGVDTKLAPTVQDVKEELVRLRPFSFAVSCSILPLTCNPSDIEISLSEILENSDKFKELFVDKEFKTLIQIMFKHFDKQGLFSDN